jgi:hypothetical protein
MAISRRCLYTISWCFSLSLIACRQDPTLPLYRHVIWKCPESLERQVLSRQARIDDTRPGRVAYQDKWGTSGWDRSIQAVNYFRQELCSIARGYSWKHEVSKVPLWEYANTRSKGCRILRFNSMLLGITLLLTPLLSLSSLDVNAEISICTSCTGLQVQYVRSGRDSVDESFSCILGGPR